MCSLRRKTQVARSVKQEEVICGRGSKNGFFLERPFPKIPLLRTKSVTMSPWERPLGGGALRCKKKDRGGGAEFDPRFLNFLERRKELASIQGGERRPPLKRPSITRKRIDLPRRGNFTEGKRNSYYLKKSRGREIARHEARKPKVGGGGLRRKTRSLNKRETLSSQKGVD